MTAELNWCNGICWSLVYAAAIIRGFKEKTWCIPKLCICLNIAWEFWMVFRNTMLGYRLSKIVGIHIVWLLLDVGVLLTWLLHDKREKRTQKFFLLTVVMIAMWIVAYKLAMWAEVAFLMNAVMSAAFVLRANKPPYEWTSIFIGVMKLIGTLAATILNGIIHAMYFILWLGTCCLLFDILYLYMLFRIIRKKAKT